MEAFLDNPFFMDNHIWAWCQEHGCPYLKLEGKSRMNVFSFLACAGSRFHPQTGREYYYLGTFYVWRGLGRLKRSCQRALKSTSRRRNLRLGLKYWRLGAQLEEVACLGALGNYYYEKKRWMVARNYFQRGAELGDSSCLTNLATVFQKEGREQGEVETLYLQAIEKGNSHAMEHLADYSSEEDQFIKYHQMAIRRGNERSYKKLVNYFLEHLPVAGIYFALDYNVKILLEEYLNLAKEKPHWLVVFPNDELNETLMAQKESF